MDTMEKQVGMLGIRWIDLRVCFAAKCGLLGLVEQLVGLPVTVEYVPFAAPPSGPRRCRTPCAIASGCRPQAQRAVTCMRLVARVGRWEVRDGVMHNSADAPECEQLRARFNALSRTLREEDAVTEEQQRFQEPIVEIDNGSFFACETFSEHLVIPPGETREVEQRFTIPCDARGWYRRMGIALQAGCVDITGSAAPLYAGHDEAPIDELPDEYLRGAIGFPYYGCPANTTLSPGRRLDLIPSSPPGTRDGKWTTPTHCVSNRAGEMQVYMARNLVLGIYRRIRKFGFHSNRFQEVLPWASIFAF